MVNRDLNLKIKLNRDVTHHATVSPAKPSTISECLLSALLKHLAQVSPGSWRLPGWVLCAFSLSTPAGPPHQSGLPGF
jgi:hypothetical protein